MTTGDLFRSVILVVGAIASMASPVIFVDGPTCDQTDPRYPECDTPPTDHSGSPDAGARYLRKGDTVRILDVCEGIVLSACERIIECETGPADPLALELQLFDQCCWDDNTCGRSVELLADVAPCIDAFPTFSCSESLEQNLPTSCLNLY